MEVIVAKTAGFCFGVRRAVEQVYQQIEQQKKQKGHLENSIHNTTRVRIHLNKSILYGGLR